MTEKELRKSDRFTPEKEPDMGSISFQKLQFTQALLKAYQRVFDEKLDWFNYQKALVLKHDAHFIDSLKKVEAWGFLKNYKDRMHPSLLPKIIEISDSLTMLKVVLMSAVGKEYARYPQHDYT